MAIPDAILQLELWLIIFFGYRVNVMGSLHRLYSLFFCLLLCSVIKADNSEQYSFDFLQIPLANTTRVENGLVLAESMGGVSLSTLINTGLWWGVCKMPGIVATLANKHQLTGSNQAELEGAKADFCLQLAPLIAVTETTLAGQVLPWPLEPLWRQPIFWSGTVLAGYSGYKLTGNWQNIPVAVMAFLAAGALSRTAGSATSTAIMKRRGINNIDDAYYKLGEYTIFASVTGIVTGSVIYLALLQKSVSPVGIVFISAVAAMVAAMLSGSIAVANIDLNNIQAKAIYIAEAVVGAGAGAGVVAGAGTVIRTVAATGAATATATTIATTAIAIAIAEAGAFAGALTGAGAEARIGAGVLAGALAGTLAIIDLNRLAQKKPALAITAAVVSATLIALVNSLSDYVVYGYPLEQSLSKTSRTLWKKFYAPLDYFSILLQ